GGNGRYVVRVLEAVGGGRFAVANTVNIDLTLTNEFAPFLRPNQFVNFDARSTVVALAAELVFDSNNVLESVQSVYNWVVENITYDTELARTVQSGYVPDLERVLEIRRGICFDYASLMTAMLRSQGIPTRLVIGYVGDVRHAWISVYSEGSGWINNVIQFNGNTWRIMDPTFSSTGNQSEEVRNFVGTGANHKQTHVH
ncbi:MAG: transglutaminase-like domain-containing protein, partial [Defluviitaleaceae bacterium]|nr:transglutaminase-like domain-containing protein [Defluviitaleaceae bacterium]